MYQAISNPITGERMITRQLPDQRNGYSSIVDLYAAPGAKVNGTHVHPRSTETFTLLDGELEMNIDGHTQAAIPGQPVVVPPGTPHAWWNAGDAEARVLVQASPEPDNRLNLMLSVLFTLADRGELDHEGMPVPPLREAFLYRYKDAIVYTDIEYANLQADPESESLLATLEKREPRTVEFIEPIPAFVSKRQLAEYYNFDE
ncbi:cupin domain-containing protein [Mycobacteroides immunogenum]|nr:cupin domain-containing protein [Mycobacteroides immunogenum]ANO04627.1 hypothetical protein BAB75_15760 [Mycobacteroides immunogenum]MCV7305435.1 cupin domain-containing protein [Mycobacteroides immunogenum]ORV78597.1 hypothetical protein AWC10_12605 [Mycobacteroides immunogenum]WJR31816.1 cupin domain-containing protein [Mycobacteroides immunogenum]